MTNELTIIMLKEYLRPDARPDETPVALLTFPVPPSSITVTNGKKVETRTLLSLGEVDFAGGSRVTEVSFSTLFPTRYDAGYCVTTDLPDPHAAAETLQRYAEGEVPVRLIISGTRINMMARLLECKVEHKGGEPGDVYVDVTFRRWAPVKPQKATASTPTTATRETPRPQAKTYTVRAGDTLQLIAKRIYGNSAKWRDLYKANAAAIGKDVTHLRAGITLVVP